MNWDVSNRLTKEYGRLSQQPLHHGGVDAVFQVQQQFRPGERGERVGAWQSVREAVRDVTQAASLLWRDWRSGSRSPVRWCFADCGWPCAVGVRVILELVGGSRPG